MAALDGKAVLVSRRGLRRIASEEFYRGVMMTAMEEDELLVACELPLLPLGTRSGFFEYSRRKGDFAIAMALVAYRLNSETIEDARIAIGGAESHPRRMRDAEQVLSGQPPGNLVFAQAAEAAAAACQPMEDHNNPAEYRRVLVQTLVMRALEGAS